VIQRDSSVSCGRMTQEGVFPVKYRDDEMNMSKLTLRFIIYGNRLVTTLSKWSSDVITSH
jgi:hypothetical protein